MCRCRRSTGPAQMKTRSRREGLHLEGEGQYYLGPEISPRKTLIRGSMRQDIAATRPSSSPRGLSTPGRLPTSRLTVSQRLSGVDPEAATGWAERREKAYHHHHPSRGGDDAWDVPAGRPDGELAQCPSEDARHQAARLRPQGRPDPDLSPPQVARAPESGARCRSPMRSVRPSWPWTERPASIVRVGCSCC